MFSSGCLMPQKQEREKKRARGAWLKYAYGITEEHYNQMVLRQRGLCAICQRALQGNRPSVDHKEGTTLVRGILCNSCNLVIGHAHEEPRLLREAASYLEKFL